MPLLNHRDVLKIKREGLHHTIDAFKRAVELVGGMLSKKKIRVVFKGTMAKTDGNVVYLPEVALLEQQNMTEEQVKQAEDFLGALRGFLDHEVGHVLATDMGVFRAFAAKGGLHKHLLNIVEDARVERIMAKLFPGSNFNLVHTNEWVWQKTMGDVEKATPFQQVLGGVLVLCKRNRDHWVFKTLSKEAQEAALTVEALCAKAPTLASTEEAGALAEEILAALKAKAEEIKKQAGQEGEQEEGQAQGKKGKKGQKQEQAGQQQGESAEGEGEEGEGEGEEGEEEGGGGKGLLESALEAGEHGAEGVGDLGKALSETAEDYVVPTSRTRWDGVYRIYTTENDRVGPAADGDRKEYKRLLEEVGRGTLGTLYRRLSMLLKAQTRSLVMHDLKEGKVDRKNLFRLPTSGDTRVFQRKVEKLDLRNVVCSLYVNESGSMNIDGRIRMAVRTCVAFAETLDKLNIPFEVVGHTTGPFDGVPDGFVIADALTKEERNLYSRFGALDMRIYKSFEERWASVFHRVTNMHPSGNTYDGDVVKTAAKRLLARPEKRKVLFLLDDGMPEPNCPTVLRQGPYLKQVATEVERAGVECIGIGMGTSSVEQFYGRSVVLNTLGGLPQIVLGELSTILLGRRRPLK